MNAATRMLAMLRGRLAHVKLVHKGLILIGVPLLCEFLFVTVLYVLLVQSQADVDRQYLHKSIIATSNTIERMYIEGGSALTMYGLSVNNSRLQDVYLKKIDDLFDSIPAQFHTLEQLCQGNPRKMAAVKEMESTGLELLAYGKTLRNKLIDKANAQTLLFQFGPIQRKIQGLLSKIIFQSDMFVAQENELSRDLPRDEARTREALKLALICGLMLSIVTSVVLLALFFDDIIQRVAKIVRNVKAVAGGQSPSPAGAGSDEIWYLSSAFVSMANKLEQSNEIRRRMTAMIGHDLRTPITSISCFLEGLQADMYGKLPNGLHDRVADVYASVGPLIEMIEDLIESEKVRTQQWDLNFERVSIDEVLSSAQSTLSALAASRDLKIEVAEHGLYVVGDKRRLLQVAVNLFSNAIKFSPEPSTIEVDSRQSEQGIVISVIDEGNGIKPGEEISIFEPFKQGSAQSGIKGAGLGLAICKSIIEAHGGTITVTNVAGRGACFSFVIPEWQPNFDSERVRADACDL